MSGAGRKGAYRKGVTNEVLNGTPVPEEGELVVQVKGSRGGNVIEIVCEDGTEGLATLPTKFRKLVWVKRGDYLIVSGADADIEVSNGKSAAIQYRVAHVLYKDQMRHIKAKGLWPEGFASGGGDGDVKSTAGLGALSAAGGAEDMPDVSTLAVSTAPPVPPSGHPVCVGAVAIDDAATGLSAGQAGDERESEEESESDDESDLFVNMNRRAPPPVSSDEDSGDED